MELFDTHAHLSDEAFDEDRHSLIPKLFESGVTRIIDVACDVRTADRTIELTFVPKSKEAVLMSDENSFIFLM